MDDQGKKNRHQPDDQISKLRLPLWTSIGVELVACRLVLAGFEA